MACRKRAILYSGFPAGPRLSAPGRPGKEKTLKKFLGLFAVLGAIAAAVMFWRRNQDDDEFLDEELE